MRSRSRWVRSGIAMALMLLAAAARGPGVSAQTPGMPPARQTPRRLVVHWNGAYFRITALDIREGTPEQMRRVEESELEAYRSTGYQLLPAPVRAFGLTLPNRATTRMNCAGFALTRLVGGPLSVNTRDAWLLCRAIGKPIPLDQRVEVGDLGVFVREGSVPQHLVVVVFGGRVQEALIYSKDGFERIYQGVATRWPETKSYGKLEFYRVDLDITDCYDEAVAEIQPRLGQVRWPMHQAVEWYDGNVFYPRRLVQVPTSVGLRRAVAAAGDNVTAALSLGRFQGDETLTLEWKAMGPAGADGRVPVNTYTLHFGGLNATPAVARAAWDGTVERVRQAFGARADERVPRYRIGNLEVFRTGPDAEITRVVGTMTAAAGRVQLFAKVERQFGDGDNGIALRPRVITELETMIRIAAKAVLDHKLDRAERPERNYPWETAGGAGLATTTPAPAPHPAQRPPVPAPAATTRPAAPGTAAVPVPARPLPGVPPAPPRPVPPANAATPRNPVQSAPKVGVTGAPFLASVASAGSRVRDSGGAWSSLKAGTPLAVGTEIEAGAAGSVRLALGAAGVELERGAAVRIAAPDVSGRPALELRNGAVLVRNGAGANLTIRAGKAVVGGAGASFRVELDPGSRHLMVRGDAGTTRVRSPFAEEFEDEVPAGETLTFVLPKD